MEAVQGRIGEAQGGELLESLRELSKHWGASQERGGLKLSEHNRAVAKAVWKSGQTTGLVGMGALGACAFAAVGAAVGPVVVPLAIAALGVSLFSYASGMVRYIGASKQAEREDAVDKALGALEKGAPASDAILPLMDLGLGKALAQRRESRAIEPEQKPTLQAPRP